MTSPDRPLQQAKTPATGIGKAHQKEAGRQSNPSILVNLQRHIGRTGLQRHLQARLEVSRPDDPHEREAERVADAVMRRPQPLEEEDTLQAKIDCTSITLACQTIPEEEEPILRSVIPREEAIIQRQVLPAEAGDQANNNLEQAIHGLEGRGRPLPQPVRDFMEPRFGADFSAVRVHTDTAAHDLARAVHAEAFTVGTNVVFGAGRYAPETDTGRHLLAHELTHVVQQRTGATLQRFSTEDCSRDEQAKISAAYSHAQVMLRHAIARLTAVPVTAATQRHFANHFGAYADWRRDIVEWHLRRDLSLLAGGDITFECESSCDERVRGYTYWVFGDIHLCPIWLSDTRLNHRAETLIHELHHWDSVRGHLDLGYHDEQQDADTIWPVAVNNADAYSMLVLDLYQGT
jgi:hypothetical protein